MRHFDEELEDLQRLMLEMGGLVESAIHRAVSVVSTRDVSLAQDVLRNEARINQIEIEIDDFAVRLLALHQPMAKDLRFLTSAIKINNDLERMGDLAVNIVERGSRLCAAPRSGRRSTFRKWPSWWIRWCATAWMRSCARDGELARGVLLSDDAVDDLRDAPTANWWRYGERPDHISSALDLIFVARNLERIADHATNIAEDVLFLVQGIDVRHHSEAQHTR